MRTRVLAVSTKRGGKTIPPPSTKSEYSHDGPLRLAFTASRLKFQEMKLIFFEICKKKKN